MKNAKPYFLTLSVHRTQKIVGLVLKWNRSTLHTVTYWAGAFKIKTKEIMLFCIRCYFFPIFTLIRISFHFLLIPIRSIPYNSVNFLYFLQLLLFSFQGGNPITLVGSPSGKCDILYLNYETTDIASGDAFRSLICNLCRHFFRVNCLIKKNCVPKRKASRQAISVVL